jgi:hypothetical protein
LFCGAASCGRNLKVSLQGMAGAVNDLAQTLAFRAAAGRFPDAAGKMVAELPLTGP